MSRDSRLHNLFRMNVRARRIALGLTQAEVAVALGMRQPSYAAIEAGRSVPSLVVLEQVAIALNTTPIELLSPSGKKIAS